MGRKQRVDYDGACHHIIVKGINNSYIFDDDVAKEFYIKLLVKYREKHDIKLFAYCIMDNHAHLLIQSGKAKGKKKICISDFMHDVQCAYAKWYNRHYKHIGPVFNNRFSNFYCRTIPYFVYIINYIHRNPVKHGKIKTYNYRYSSYRDYQLGKGLCDLEDCYHFLEMSRSALMAHLVKLKTQGGYPFLDALIEKLSRCQNREAVEKLLLELAFRLEDIRGSRLVRYFDYVQRTMIDELNNLKILSVKVISNLFGVSESYVYQRLNST